MHYEAQVVSVSDYYPFGMGIKEREWKDSTFSYRYGFNGQEKDDEVSGEGNTLDFGARIYDSRLGRWMSIDPQYVHYETPYSLNRNSPLIYVDKDGELPIPVITGIIGAVANATVGIIKGESAKQVLARAGSGFIAGAVAGLFPAGAAALAQGVGLGAISSTAVVTQTLGWFTAGTATVMGSTAGAVVETPAKYILDKVLGNKTNYNSKSYANSIVLSIPLGLLGSAADKVIGKGTNTISELYLGASAKQIKNIEKVIFQRLKTHAGDMGVDLSRNELKDLAGQISGKLSDANTSLVSVVVDAVEKTASVSFATGGNLLVPDKKSKNESNDEKD